MNISDVGKALCGQGRMPAPPPGWERRNMSFKTPGIKGVLYLLLGERRQVVDSLKVITQNLNKPGSKWAEMAKSGHKIAHVWRNGLWAGVVVDGTFWKKGDKPE